MSLSKLKLIYALSFFFLNCLFPDTATVYMPSWERADIFIIIIRVTLIESLKRYFNTVLTGAGHTDSLFLESDRTFDIFANVTLGAVSTTNKLRFRRAVCWHICVLF